MGLGGHIFTFVVVLPITLIKSSTILSLENDIQDQRAVDKPPSQPRLVRQNFDESVEDLLQVWSIRAIETAAEALHDKDNIPEYNSAGRSVGEIDALANNMKHPVENRYTNSKFQSSKDLNLNSGALQEESSDKILSTDSAKNDFTQQSNLSEKIDTFKTLADETLNKLNLALNQKVRPILATNVSNSAVGTNRDSSVVKKRNIWSFINSNNHMTCDIDVIQTSLTFSENIETSGGTITLICRGQVVVNKCEGMCSSSVTPDVNHYDGYLKQCSCCRDSSTRQRDVTLRSCFIGGAEVSGHFLTRTIVEPSTCACLACRG